MFLSLMLLLPFLPFLIPVEAEPGTGTCAPVTWTNEVKPGETRPPPPPSRRFQLTDRKGNVPLPGEVNCRYSGWSGSQVDASTCAQLATKYKVGLDKFFELNRSRVSAGCGDIKPQTEYCMAGSSGFQGRPLRAQVQQRNLYWNRAPVLQLGDVDLRERLVPKILRPKDFFVTMRKNPRTA
ncbi:uncharacterized protein B0I36DRAFT_345658 [Microdochium trichocladiopsis]|uniref:LysM domain-containing protein n=1 Tax=Microdochium trichocladiopsis TaxID=1682393 RepID=A0A9P8YDY4_9PEZI|nr:uncharacterized protein B0I36DRAFT_345658 [Microdochium trichocladiopsis]KAH7037563.1 hypothetical protein B0I36DRAFT_345658 [Microdochium trichocladiopsis]